MSQFVIAFDIGGIHVRIDTPNGNLKVIFQLGKVGDRIKGSQVFHGTDEQLKETIGEVKGLLKDELFDLDVLLMNEEDNVNTLPFFKT